MQEITGYCTLAEKQSFYLHYIFSELKIVTLTMLHYVRFRDLETSLVETCNDMQRVEKYFVTLVLLLTRSPDESDLTIASGERVFKENLVKDMFSE